MNNLNLSLQNAVDLEQERLRVSELLRIPVSSINLSLFFCEIFLNHHSIGSLPISQSVLGLHYDNSKAAVQKLNWQKIYQVNQAEINDLIKKHLKTDSFRVIPSSFRRLYVEDPSDTLIASFECKFERSTWKIFDEGIIAPNTERNKLK